MVTSGNVDGAIIESIQKPTIFFIYANRTCHDWLPAHKNDLWNAPGNKKTIYDPCPAGWCVPVCSDGTVSDRSSDDYSPWKGYMTWSTLSWTSGANTGGAKFVNAAGKGALYPASGHRSGGDGSHLRGGEECSYWSASVAGEGGISLNILHIGYGNPINLYHRAFGMSVRCVKEN
jgi:hypothetical protein